MSQWHRENPELAFIGADPWMDHESHRQAYEELRHMGLVHDDEATETNQEET